MCLWSGTDLHCLQFNLALDAAGICLVGEISLEGLQVHKALEVDLEEGANPDKIMMQITMGTVHMKAPLVHTCGLNKKEKRYNS